MVKHMVIVMVMVRVRAGVWVKLASPHDPHNDLSNADSGMYE